MSRCDSVMHERPFESTSLKVLTRQGPNFSVPRLWCEDDYSLGIARAKQPHEW